MGLDSFTYIRALINTRTVIMVICFCQSNNLVCIVFSNWSAGSSEGHKLNQLMVGMDGMSTMGGVIMLGSTNREDVLEGQLPISC